MAGCHHVMLLLDTAGGAAGPGPAALRLLTYLGCRFGLARVRWAFRLFDSQGARAGPARASAFRELGARACEELERALAARLAAGAHLPGPAPRAAHTRGALLEALLDYPWDAPDVSSPARPARRRRGPRAPGGEAEAAEAAAAAPGGFAHAVFLLAACPHSRRELLQFAAGGQAPAQGPPPTRAQVLDALLPGRLQELMAARGVTLYWVDTTERARLWDSPDHHGYWTVCELLRHVGGTVLPAEAVSPDFPGPGGAPRPGGRWPASASHLAAWASALPAESTLDCLLRQPPEHGAAFLRREGALRLPVEGSESLDTWPVVLEPLAPHQRHCPEPMRISVRGTVAQWSPPAGGAGAADSWLLRGPEGDASAGKALLEQLAGRLAAEELHLVVDVDPGEGWPPSTGVLSPFSADAAILTVLRPDAAGWQGQFLHVAEAERTRDTASLCSSVFDDVMNGFRGSLAKPAAPAPPVPEWAQQELGRTPCWSPAVLERWFPRSNLSGASSSLMESFWLLHAAASRRGPSPAADGELTQRLSELYQSRAQEDAAPRRQDDGRKTRRGPRTPVRRKMSAMCRSLKMLNVARLNVKAQRAHPGGGPAEAAGARGQAGGRAAHRPGDRGRTPRGPKAKEFKTEEALLAYIHESYQETVAAGDAPLRPCAQSVVSAVRAFLKASGAEELEGTCRRHLNSLLKTSGSLRRDLGRQQDQGHTVRECRLQVLLRLEMCVQCPALQADTEQVVQEVVDLLRVVCLAEDLARLASFLEEVLGLYIDSIPKTLGELYDGLGLVIPRRLASVLPADFFSDDSLTQDSGWPPLPEPPGAGADGPSPAAAESGQLEALRSRSAQKRRKSALVRRKSVAEAPQTLRQIEVPGVARRAARTETAHPAPPRLLPGKDAAQEVTKVRRNLFNQGGISPSKRSQKQVLPRSQSVSAVEGLRHQPDSLKRTRGHHRLLTKSVAETPAHKQTSRRLLHRQIQGRSSDPGPEVDVVAESPDRGEQAGSLRRSPRIKQLLGRTRSGSFYPASQPASRGVRRVHSLHQAQPAQREATPVGRVRSPKSLLFGAVSEAASPAEKGSAHARRPSRGPPGPAARQTPRKTTRPPPASAQAAVPGAPGPPQSPPCTPERARVPPAEVTPAKRAGWGGPPGDAASGGRGSTAPPRGGHAACPPEGTPGIPRRPRPGPPGQLQQPARPAPESPGSEGAPGAAPLEARGRVPPGPEHPQPRAPAASAVEPAPPWAHRGAGAPTTTTTAGDSAQPSAPPGSPGRPGASRVAAPGGALRRALAAPPAPAGRALSGPAPTAPPRLSRSATPPSAVGRRRSETPETPETPEPGRGFLGRSPESPAAPAAAPPSSLAGSESSPGAAHPSPPPAPARPGSASSWPAASPLLAAGNAEPLTLLDAAEHGHGDSLDGCPSPGDGASASPVTAGPEPSLCSPGLPPSLSSAPSSPRTPPQALCGALRGLWCPAARQGAALPTAPAGAPASPRTYEVQLEMQASGLPKLRIKKVEPGGVLEAEPPAGGGGALPGPGAPRASRPSGKPEPTYLSPPCLRPSHSTPGKAGGQTYICQCCTPTRGPPSTPSPFQADVGVPWTPSPKHSGKSTPDTIKDWPRRKRPADCGPGRSDAPDAPGSAPLLQPEAKVQGPAFSMARAPLLGDFELEGVCQLPEQSPPWEGQAGAEEATGCGHFGLASRKRRLSAEEEEKAVAAVGQPKRPRELQREGSEAGGSEEGPPGGRGRQLASSAEDDEVFAPGATPPPGCAAWSGLSASGLQALTQSPLLFPGRTPAQPSDGTDEDTDVLPPGSRASPFSHALARRRPAGRTYTRKKLIS